MYESRYLVMQIPTDRNTMGKEVDMLWEACHPLLEGIREIITNDV